MQYKVQRKILRQKEESTKYKDIRSKCMNGNYVHVKVIIQRCMSMLEWQTTTTDAEVTNGRQLHNLITITTTMNKAQRTMNDFEDVICHASLLRLWWSSAIPTCSYIFEFGHL